MEKIVGTVFFIVLIRLGFINQLPNSWLLQFPIVLVINTVNGNFFNLRITAMNSYEEPKALGLYLLTKNTLVQK